MKQYIWFNKKIIDINQANINILSHTLHYGDGVFEGMRCYKTINNNAAIFRLDDHIKRLFKSAKSLDIKIDFNQQEIKQQCLRIVRKNNLKNCYIRPIVFRNKRIGLNPQGLKTNIAIIAIPFDNYFQKEAIKVKISKFIRLHPRSIISEAKACGYYINSILATIDAKKEGFDEALMLDYKGYVAEGAGENIFVIKNNKLYTPKLGSILPGITRDTVIKIAKDLKIKVIEKNITVNEVLNSDEAFFTGTAVEIMPIYQINNKLINNGKLGKITNIIKYTYHQIVKGEINQYYHWLSFVY